MLTTDLSGINSIVVAGGQASRLDAVDKVMLPLGLTGKPLLVEVIEACPGKVIVAGTQRDIPMSVTWVIDKQLGGGPAAGIWAALELVDSEYVFISAGDQRLTKEIVNQVCLAAIGNDGAWAIRSDGQGQPLLTCVKTNLIRDLLQESAGQNASPLRLMGQLNMIGVKVNEGQIRDVDTWVDVAKLIKGDSVSDVTAIWLTRVAATLGIAESEIPIDQLLDVTRYVAHNVERKSAPLTTFLIGLAAGKSNVPAHELIERVNLAVAEWNQNAKS